MWLPPYSSKPLLEADFGFQRKKKNGQKQNGTMPRVCELGAGSWIPRVRKSLWAQAWQGLREDGRHSLAPVRQRGYCVQQLLGLNKNRETLC